MRNLKTKIHLGIFLILFVVFSTNCGSGGFMSSKDDNNAPAVQGNGAQNPVNPGGSGGSMSSKDDNNAPAVQGNGAQNPVNPVKNFPKASSQEKKAQTTGGSLDCSKNQTDPSCQKPVQQPQNKP